MCRLFALHAGDRDVAADFWLLDAPDSIARQSEINADGYGLAALTSKHGLILMRNPVEAASDSAYLAVAHRLVAAEMIVHLRYANTGDTSLANTHPFAQDGRLFAHNGVVGNLAEIEERLGENRAMVMGETDSERFFALITLAAREHGGDIRAGITAAVREVVDRYELFSLNFVLAERGNIWAFRYPEANPLMLRGARPAGRAATPNCTMPTPPARCKFTLTTPRRSRWWSSPASGSVRSRAGRTSSPGNWSTSAPISWSTAKRSSTARRGTRWCWTTTPRSPSPTPE